MLFVVKALPVAALIDICEADDIMDVVELTKQQWLDNGSVLIKPPTKKNDGTVTMDFRVTTNQHFTVVVGEVPRVPPRQAPSQP